MSSSQWLDIAVLAVAFIAAVSGWRSGALGSLLSFVTHSSQGCHTAATFYRTGWGRVYTASQRHAIGALASEILDSTGLYDARHPRENQHYRVLVAHLLM